MSKATCPCTGLCICHWNKQIASIDFQLFEKMEPILKKLMSNYLMPEDAEQLDDLLHMMGARIEMTKNGD